MDPAVKRTQEKLWLAVLLWWSLLLQLVCGGKNFCVCVCVCFFPANLNCSMKIGFVKFYYNYDKSSQVLAQ